MLEAVLYTHRHTHSAYTRKPQHCNVMVHVKINTHTKKKSWTDVREITQFCEE